MIDAFAIAANQPWMIRQEALETILAIAHERHGDVEALQTRLGRPLDNARNVSMRDGVAVIPVTGPIFRYANLFTEISGATSTGVLARDIQTALDNPYVRGIALDINSPGGEATGINELAKLIRDARGIKPITAYVSGTGASAAYWLASAADQVVLDELAVVGSIGVVMSYLDTSKRDAASGVRAIEIVSSQSPDKRVDVATDEGRAKVQSIVDAMAQVFVQAVADNRGVSVDKVLADFGKGGVLVGASAVQSGMADRIGSLETVIAELAGSASKSARKQPMSNKPGQVTVSTTDDLRTAIAAGYQPENITIAAQDTAAIRAEATEAGRREGAEAERKRINAITAMSCEGFEVLRTEAINNGHSPEQFAMALLQGAKDRGITLGAARSDAPPAATGAPATDDVPLSAQRTPNTTDIYARRAAAGKTA